MTNNVNRSWSVFEGYDPNDPRYTVEANGSTLAYIRPGISNPNPKEVATLMAAAPKLLAALIDCREALRRAGATGELKVVDAAIAKARDEAAKEQL